MRIIPTSSVSTADLLAIVEQLWRNIEQRTPATCELARMFRRLADPQRRSQAHELWHAISQFNRLPAEERARIMNGWACKVDFDQPATDNGRSALLCVFPGFDVAGIEFLARDSVDQVLLLIEPGTSKRDVLAAIDTLRGQIDSQWDRLICDPWNLRADADKAAALLLTAAMT